MIDFDYPIRYGEVKTIPAKICGTSLVGIDRSHGYPLSFGNYFDLRNDNTYVINFWAENFEEACTRFLKDGLVQVVEYGFGIFGKRKFCIIFDSRIPEDWYNKKLCFTGFGDIQKYQAIEIYNIFGGDVNNELEIYDDPISYYAKRGGVYCPKTGIVKHTINSTSRTISTKYTFIENSEIKAKNLKVP